MTLSNRRLGFIAGCTFVVGAIASFPASVAYSWFAPETVVATDIRGTLWRGESGRAVIANNLDVLSSEWRFSPGRLFGGRLAYRLSAAVADGKIDGDVALGPGQHWVLSDTQLELPLSLLPQQLTIVQVSGKLLGNIDTAEIDAGEILQLDGTFAMIDLVIPLIGNDVLGSFRAECAGVISDTIRCDIRDSGDGPLELQSELLLTESRTFEFTGKVRATQRANAALRNNLKLTGEADPSGWHALNQQGSF